MITVSHVTKAFGSLTAVRDISFSVAQGEVVGLLGPNGAGKTTTMRIMTGYYVPDSGEVTIGDISVTNDPARARKEIGYLPESNPLYKDMLVSQYLGFIAGVREMQKTAYREAFDRVVEDTGIAEVFYRPIGELSKGYKQRVGLAGALIADPSVLILDEPTEGLDPNQRNDMRTLLARLAKHKTIIVSTHVISEIQAIAERVIVLKEGAIVAMGTVDELTGAQTGVRYTVEVAGKGVEDAMKELDSVERVEPVLNEHGKVTVCVHARSAEQFARELSKLIGARNYVLHRMVPEAGGLERAFRDLTLGDTIRIVEDPASHTATITSNASTL